MSGKCQSLPNYPNKSTEGVQGGNIHNPCISNFAFSHPHITQISDLVEAEEWSQFEHTPRLLHQSASQLLTNRLVPVRAPVDRFQELYTKKVQSSPYTGSFFNSDAIFEVTFFGIWENFPKSIFRIWPKSSPISAETIGKLLVLFWQQQHGRDYSYMVIFHEYRFSIS